jgi:hypothetical protein
MDSRVSGKTNEIETESLRDLLNQEVQNKRKRKTPRFQQKEILLEAHRIKPTIQKQLPKTKNEF